MRAGLYALYRGDEFIDVGTAEELARKRHTSAGYIRFLATQRAREIGHRTLAHRIEEGDEGDDERRD